MSPPTTSVVVGLYACARWRILNWLDFRSIFNALVMVDVEMEASVFQANASVCMVSLALTATLLARSVEDHSRFVATLAFVMYPEGANAMLATEGTRASFDHV